MQERLAALRTDLDSFSEAEAFALMTSGYRMLENEFASRAAPLRRPIAPARDWSFLAVEKYANLAKGHEEGVRALLEILGVGAQKAFKIWRLSRPLQLLAVALAVVIAAGFAVAWWSLRGRMFFIPVPVDSVGWTLLVFGGGAALGKMAMWIFDSRHTLSRIAFAIGMSLLGFLAARLHLWLFDPLFLETGKVENLAHRKPGRIGRMLGLILSLVVGLGISAVWLWLQSDAFDRRRIIGDAPVAQAVETRTVGIPRVAAWASALDRANEKEKADQAWQLVKRNSRALTSPEEKVTAMLFIADALADVGRKSDAAEQLKLITAELPAITDRTAQIWARSKAALLRNQLDVAKEGDGALSRALADLASTVQGDPWQTARVARWLADEHETKLASEWAIKAVEAFDQSKPPMDAVPEFARQIAASGNQDLARRVLENAMSDVPAKMNIEQKRAFAKAWADLGDFENASTFGFLTPADQAVALAQAGRIDDALKLKVQIDKSDQPAVLTQIAAALVQANQPQRSRELLDEVIAILPRDSIDPADSATRAQVAKTLAAVGAVKDATDLASQIPLAADRLDAYTAILDRIEDPSGKSRSARPMPANALPTDPSPRQGSGAPP
jgi:tetratricopeptide (TPR) repeat protein